MSTVSAGSPYWSVMIPTYNRTIVREALKSVLQQDRGVERMQIAVVDNCSPNVDVKAIVEEVGRGRVEFYQNETNIGMVENWNSCLRRARGEWVHILHDDDVVYPGFYEALEAAGAAPAGNREIGAAFCRVANIDAAGSRLGDTPLERPTAGVYTGFEVRCFNGNAVLFPGIVGKKKVYEEMGGFDASLWYSPDWIMWVRIAQKYAVWYEPRALAGYRRHDEAQTSKFFRNGEDISGLAQALDRMVDILPKNLETRQALTAVREHMAKVGIGNAREALQRGDLYTAMCQAREGYKCSSGPALMRHMDGGLMPFWDNYVRASSEIVKGYAAQPGDAALLDKARGIRRRLAQQIVDFGPEWAHIVWDHVRAVGALLVQSGLQDEIWTEEEKSFVGSFVPRLADTAELEGRWSQWLNVALMYCQPQELGLPVAQVPDWLLGDYLQAMFRVPRKWREASSPAAMQAVLLRLEADVQARAGSGVPLWQQAGQFVAGKMAAFRKPNP